MGDLEEEDENLDPIRLEEGDFEMAKQLGKGFKKGAGGGECRLTIYFI